jgi:hypothetical protein
MPIIKSSCKERTNRLLNMILFYKTQFISAYLNVNINDDSYVQLVL